MINDLQPFKSFTIARLKNILLYCTQCHLKSLSLLMTSEIQKRLTICKVFLTAS